jgi:hypothetical protein
MMSTERQATERLIVDESGVQWRITEIRVWDANGRGASSLIAAHECGFRRLWHFPEDWAQMSDTDLAKLVAKPVGKISRQVV